MTTPNPPVPPSDPSRDPSASPTEPVPSMWAPPEQPAVETASSTALGSGALGTASQAPARSVAFQAASPEPDPIPAVTPVQPTVRRSTGGGILNIALGVAVLIAASGIAFAVGRATAPAPALTAAANGGTFRNGTFGRGSFDPGAGGGAGQVPGGGGRGFGFGGGLSIQGTVDSVTADSVTIKSANGQTITVGLDANTAYHQQAAGSQADVTAGKTVIVQLTGGFRPGANGANGGNAGNGGGNAGGNAGGANGAITLGSAGSITVVP